MRIVDSLDEPTTIERPTPKGGIELPVIEVPHRHKDTDLRPAVAPAWLAVIAVVAVVAWMLIRKFT